MDIETFFDISDQVMLFLLAVLVGAGLGILFDVFRAMRVVFPPAKKSGLTALSDIIFWLIYGFTIFVYSVQYGRGQVRFFFFIGSLLGFILYLLTIGNVVLGVIKKVYGYVSEFIHFVYSYTISPIVKIMRFIYQKESAVFVRSHKNDIKFSLNVLNLLKKPANVLYNKKAKLD